MARDIAERKAQLLAKQEKLKNQLNTLQQREKNEIRKRDTHRKIVVGGAILAAIETNAGLDAMVRTVLAASVGRARDREVIADLLNPRTAAPSPQLAAQKPETPPAPPPSQPAYSPSPFLSRLATLKDEPATRPSTADYLSDFSRNLGRETKG